MFWSTNGSFNLESMGPLLLLEAVVRGFYKFSIGETHCSSCPIKVITIMMSDYVYFESNIQAKLFIEVEKINDKVSKSDLPKP